MVCAKSRQMPARVCRVSSTDVLGDGNANLEFQVPRTNRVSRRPEGNRAAFAQSVPRVLLNAIGLTIAAGRRKERVEAGKHAGGSAVSLLGSAMQ